MNKKVPDNLELLDIAEDQKSFTESSSIYLMSKKISSQLPLANKLWIDLNFWTTKSFKEGLSIQLPVIRQGMPFLSEEMITLGHSATPYHSTVDLRAKNHKQQVPIYCNFRWNSLHYNPTCHCPFSYPVVPPCSVRILAPSGHTALRMLPHQTESRPPILGKSHASLEFLAAQKTALYMAAAAEAWTWENGEHFQSHLWQKFMHWSFSLFKQTLHIIFMKKVYV